MEEITEEENIKYIPDNVAELAHFLIEKHAEDGSKPFMLEGHPFMHQTEKRLVRACFYYSLVVTPKITMLYDNCDRGGMCDMTLDEVTAIWRTPELLSALGSNFEKFGSGEKLRFDGAQIPKPYTLDGDKSKADGEEEPEQAFKI